MGTIFKNQILLKTIFLITLLIISSSQAESQTYALLVGCSDYSGTEYDLDYVPTNIQNMHDVLNQIYGISNLNITSYIDTVTTGSTLEEKIQTLLNHTDATMFVIYLSGHGNRSGSYSYYDMPNGLFWDFELESLLSNTNVQTVVINQHCHAGGFASNCGNFKTVVMTASSIDLLAWGRPNGSDFTCNLCDGFAWHNNQYLSWASYFFNWTFWGLLLPDSADDNLDGIVNLAEGFDYAEDNIESWWSSLWGWNSDPQINGQNSSCYFGVELESSGIYRKDKSTEIVWEIANRSEIIGCNIYLLDYGTRMKKLNKNYIILSPTNYYSYIIKEKEKADIVKNMYEIEVISNCGSSKSFFLSAKNGCLLTEK